MAEKIKNFFQKKKLDIKFSSAGPGHRLDETPQTVQHKDVPVVSQVHQSDAANEAGAAAFNRLQKGAPKQSIKDAAVNKSSDSTDIVANSPHAASPPTVSFSCPTVHMICFVCHKSFPENDVIIHIESCLHEEYTKEPLSSSVHMIHALCTNSEKKTACIETLVRYLDNIISDPTDIKYRKIRASNKTFQEKVCNVTGAVQFLKAIGFIKDTLPFQDGFAEFYVLPEKESAYLLSCKELLLSTTPLRPVLDRCPQLFVSMGEINKFDLPDSFYNMSIDEIKREQKLRTQALERESVLRTKAMRDKDEIKSVVKYYKYVLIRIRFPEGVMLQGVFRPLEQFLEIRQLVVDQLIDPTRLFNLSFLHTSLNDDLATIAKLGLAPAAVLNLSWVDNMLTNQQYEHILKPEIIKTLTVLST